LGIDSDVEDKRTGLSACAKGPRVFLDYLLQDERFEKAAPRRRRGGAVYAPTF
jgi:hypothetical protein